MSTSSKFPLLKLPLLVIEHVINRMELVVVLDLAFSSKIFKSVLTNAKLKVNHFGWTLSHEQTGISIYRNFETLEIRVDLECDLESEQVDLDGTTFSLAKQTFEFEGSTWFVSPGKQDDGLKQRSAWKLGTLEVVTSFLMSFVRCRRFKLEHSLRQNLLSNDFFIWKHLEQKSLDLEFSGVFGLPFEVISGILKFAEEDLKAEVWRVEAQLSNSKSGFEKLNGTLKSWIRGDSLKNLTFLKILNSSNIDSNQLFKDIDNQVSTFSEFHIFDRMGRVGKKAISRDIRRESDGRRGTVIVDDFKFGFIVWIPADEKKN